MILIIGGRAQGKSAYLINNLHYCEDDIADAVLDKRPALNHLHKLVAASQLSQDELISLLSNKEVIVCDELGCGPVPMEKASRDLRERVGNICQVLAAKADTVIRIYCGLPQAIKGELPCK